jgi:hypothetical protein
VGRLDNVWFHGYFCGVEFKIKHPKGALSMSTEPLASPSGGIEEGRMEALLRDYSLLFSKIHWAVSILSVAILIVLILVFALSSSTTLAWDKRVVLCGVVGVVLLSSVGLLFLSRKEGKLLIVLCIVVAFVEGLSLGLCTWYL